MLPAEITDLVSKLSYGDRAELVGLLLDSLDDADVDDTDEDSMTTALRRSAEMKSGQVTGLTEEEFWAAVQTNPGRK